MILEKKSNRLHKNRIKTVRNNKSNNTKTKITTNYTNYIKRADKRLGDKIDIKKKMEYLQKIVSLMDIMVIF